MATTTYGTAYVQNTDLVSGWPAASLTVANRIDAVSYAGNGINAQTGTTYTLVLTDAGKNVTLSNASAVTVTIPANSSVAYPTGTVISFTNLGAGTVTISAAGGVTLNGSTLTIAQYSRSSIMKTATDTWVLTSGGGIPKATVSATTGSPTIDTSSRPGKTIYKFTGSGSITIGGTGGTAEVLCVGAGGSGGHYGGGGGAGAVLSITQAFLPGGVLTVTVGAGGAYQAAQSSELGQGNNGEGSLIGSYIAPGGGAGASLKYAAASTSAYGSLGLNGGSGGGGSSGGIGTAKSGGAGITSVGNAGGSSNASGTAGGGGGAGAVGANGTASLAGNGGNGVASSITGSSVTYGGGGGGSSNTSSTSTGGTGGGGNSQGGAGTANTGGGGGAGGSTVPGNGGSGVVIVVIG